MATVKIFRINYKSDFILTLNSDAGWMTPFCIKFWTGAPSQAYFVSFDGTTYTHCAPVAGEPTKLQVQFDDHHLPIGDLKFQIGYHFTVADFPNDTEDEVLNQASVIIEQDGEPAKVMLDFNGETAPEIEFSLPAYANEAQRIANEEERIEAEQQRVEAEQTRQLNEQTRVNQETARVNEYAELKVDAVAATRDANDAATLATQKAGLANDAAELATQKAGLANDAAELATQKAGLANDAAALAAQKAGLADDAATLANQKAQYAKDQGDYAKEQGDYAKAQTGLIPVDVTRTQTDATFVNGDNDPLFYLRQATSSLAGLMTAAEHTKLNDMPSAQETNVGLIYDVSALHPTSGVNGGSTYASLSAALAVIPQGKQKGGMSVKFVQSSDNKYVQYRLTADEWTTDTNYWAIYSESMYVDNPEFIYVKTDSEDKILWAIKTDGDIYYGAGCPQQVKDYIEEKISSLPLDEYEDIVAFLSDYLGSDTTLKAIIDGINAAKVDKIEGKSLIDEEVSESLSAIEDTEGRGEITTDSEGKIISYRDSDGVKHEKVGIETDNATVNHLNLTESGMTEFQQALKDSGFNLQVPIDWSDKQYIHIPTKPTCAVINITGVDELPQYKGVNSHAWMEFWDKNGNYFKKRVILDAQGRSSLIQHKKNFSADFCEDEWEGDETTTIKIGDWVSQDSFHFKAYYTDMFKFANITGYRIWENFRKTMNITNDKPFKEFFIDDYSSTEGSIDNFTQNSKDEAKCVPDGFPVCVYLNGDFYGVFFWQLKKHRDNYLLDRNKTNNIHLDGEDYANFFNGIISWEKLEIRNPKPKKSKWTLYCMDGTKYDGDSPKELIDSSSENWDGNNTSHIKSAEVKENIIALSHYMSDIAPYEIVSTSNGDITIGTFRGDYANDINYIKGAWVKSADNYYMSLHSSNVGNPVSDTSNWVNISSNLETLRSEIEKRFGIRWIIDYVILVNLERNSDVFLQNAQWITWGDIDNHMKWSLCPYDLDASFGVNSVSSYKFMSPEYGAFGNTATTPIRYVYKYYIEDVRERWKILRDAKIIDKDAIMSIVTDLVNSIGNDNYELEYKKWDESPCCRASGINTKWQLLEMSITYNDAASNWSSSTTYFNGSHVKHGHMWFESQQGNNIGHEPNLEQDTEWWKNVSAKPGFYAAGSEIWDGYSNFFKFKALEDVTITEDESFDGRLIDHYVDAPFEKLYQYYPHESGVFDSLYRIYYWLQEQIEIMDNEFLYQ